MTQSLSVWIASLRYTMVTLHSDKEPAICWVRDKVQASLKERGMSVTTRASPTHSSESNGGAERAIQSVRGLARTLVTQVERTGLTFGADSPLWLWAFQTCGMDLDTVWPSSRHKYDSSRQALLQAVPPAVAYVCGGGDRSETWSTGQQAQKPVAVAMEAQTNT